MINISIVEGEYALAVKEHGNVTKAALAMGIPRTTFNDRLKKEKQDIPPDQSLKGVSTLYDNNGNIKQQWVKTHQDKEAVKTALSLFAEGLGSEIKPIKPKLEKPVTLTDLLTCYIITDYHMGQLSWAEETGADWDTDIAFDNLPKYLNQLMGRAPDSEVGVLAQLGDFLHWDGFDAVTPMSGHLLDADTRFHKLAFMAGEAVRSMIDLMLSKHGRVHVIMAEGNHDMASSVWLTVLVNSLYRDEPRVTVDTSPSPYYCFEWGETSLFFHHGHKKKMSEISKTFTAMFRDVFGRTKRSYAHMGHMHHRDVKEDALMIVEQHETLAARDAYAARGGWLSMRGANAITYSKEGGEEERTTIRP